MANKYEDFERFLKANFNSEWLRFTNEDAKRLYVEKSRSLFLNNFSLYDSCKADVAMLKSNN